MGNPNLFNDRSSVMGQYHLTVNLDKKEFLMPHKLGVGLKLREQTGFGNSIPDALFMLLACSNGYGGGDFIGEDKNKMIGRWAGDRIAIVGDYAQVDDLPMMWGAENIFTLCHDYGSQCIADECIADASSHYLDISDMIIPVMMTNDDRMDIDMTSMGWRNRKPVEIDSMISMDELLQGGLSTDG